MAPKGMSRRQTWMNLQNPGLSTEQAKSTKALPDWWHFSKLRTSWQPMLLMVVSSSGTLSFETGEVAHLFFGEDDGIGMRHWHVLQRPAIGMMMMTTTMTTTMVMG